MTVMSGNELGRELCKLFGLDEGNVSKITIVAEAGAVALVTVERAIPVVDKDALIETLTTFHDWKKFKVVETDKKAD